MLPGLLVGLLLLAAPTADVSAAPTCDSDEQRQLVVWAWERPERLTFINPRCVAVAFLAETLSLRGDTLAAAPRRQPLSIPPGTALIAVVRIETRSSIPPALHDAQRKAVGDRLLEVVRRTGALALQIDFDAALSEREFYGTLLADIRRRLPSDVELSITALASWCMDDPWIARLPIDRAVPMLFRMGPQAAALRRRSERPDAFPVELCRCDLGVSTDEPWVRRSARYWVFNPRPWSEAAIVAASRRALTGECR
jgi:hypothetical protein